MMEDLFITELVELQPVRSITTWNNFFTIPMNSKVNGEELAWDLIYSIRYNNQYEVKFKLLFQSDFHNSLNLVSYIVDFPSLLESTRDEEGPFKINKWYTLILKKKSSKDFPLKIKVEPSMVPANHLTIQTLYNADSGDVEIHCGDFRVKAHKSILAAHSDVLSVAFNNADFIEVKTGIYTIAEEHMSVDILEDVLKWMYLHNIENMTEKSAKLLAAAEYFQIEGLKEICDNLLVKQVTVENCLRMMDMAFQYNVKNLKAKCNTVFAKNRKQVLAKTRNPTKILSHVPMTVLELLGIELEKVKLKP